MPIHGYYASFLNPSQIEGPLLEWARSLLYCNIEDFIAHDLSNNIIHKCEYVLDGGHRVEKSILLKNMAILAQMSKEESCPTLRAYVNQHFPNSVYGVYTEMVKLLKTSTKVFYGDSDFKEYILIGGFRDENHFPDEEITLKGETWEISAFSKDQSDIFKTKMESPYSTKICCRYMDARVDVPYLGRIYVEDLWLGSLDFSGESENLEKEGLLNTIRFVVPNNLRDNYHLRMTYNKIKGIEKCK